MQYTRAGARRRRVLAADTAVDAEQTASDGGPAMAQPPVPDNRYADGALAERQLRVTDLIPRRRLTLILLAAALASVVAGLVDLYGCFFIDPFQGDRGALAALDLRRPGNLADWCASTSMLVCAAACLLVFAVRRHRTDDLPRRLLQLGVAGGALRLVQRLAGDAGAGRFGRGRIAPRGTRPGRQHSASQVLLRFRRLGDCRPGGE